MQHNPILRMLQLQLAGQSGSCPSALEAARSGCRAQEFLLQDKTKGANDKNLVTFAMLPLPPKLQIILPM